MTIEISQVAAISNKVLDEVEKAIIGKRILLSTIMSAILADGHVLLEDYPGLGKTLLANSLATALGAVVTETDPGERWTAEISGSPVTVETDLTAQATITNTHAAPGSIYIRKVVPAGEGDPNNPGQTFSLGFVDFDAGRTVAGSFPAGTGFQGKGDLAPVTWTVREQNIPTNWTLYDIACESQNGTSTIEPFVAGQTSVDVDLASGSFSMAWEMQRHARLRSSQSPTR